MRTLYFECNMGAAGDMLMGALYEICDRKELFLNTMNEALAPWQITISAESSVKHGITGTHMIVSIHGEEEPASPDGACDLTEHEHFHENDKDSTEHLLFHANDKDNKEHQHFHENINAAEHHHHTNYHSMLEKIQALQLPKKVRENAVAIYRLIGEAEARVHGTVLEQIHFHEVGTLDALADVVGCTYLIHLIAPEQILSSPIHVGNGFVRCAHGILSVPTPAAAEILMGVPYYTGSIAGELCTPTGAAILKHYVSHFLAMPPLTPEAIGYGMGNKDFEIANCIRIFLGESIPQRLPSWNDPQAFSSLPDDAMDDKDSAMDNRNGEKITDVSFPCDDSVLSISCNIDDMTGEALGLATEILMTAGALDVYTIPIQMKKNRPGILLTCICHLDEKDKFTGLFFLHTSTRGVRYQIFDRAKLESTFETRPTVYGNIRIKKSAGYGIQKEKLEFEDLKSVVFKNHNSVSLEDVKKSVFRGADIHTSDKEH